MRLQNPTEVNTPSLCDHVRTPIAKDIAMITLGHVIVISAPIKKELQIGQARHATTVPLQ